MKKTVQHLNRMLLLAILTGVSSAGLATTASAVGVGVGVNANIGTGVQVSAPASAQAGATASTNMSASGSANSNAQWQEGASMGADRAGERMNEQGAENMQSGESQFEAASTTTQGLRAGKR